MGKAVELIKIPTHGDERGDLSVIEMKDYVDWPVKRVYYVTNTKLPRGGHCVKGEKKIYVMMQGKCRAKIYDGQEWQEFVLEGPGDALLLEADRWREFEDFSEGAVMAAISNMNYDKSKYIMALGEFEKYVMQNNE